MHLVKVDDKPIVEFLKQISLTLIDLPHRRLVRHYKTNVVEGVIFDFVNGEKLTIMLEKKLDPSATMSCR